MSSGQCRLAPLIQVIQDCSPLYHYTVKLLFKLHSCECSRGAHIRVLPCGLAQPCLVTSYLGEGRGPWPAPALNAGIRGLGNPRALVPALAVSQSCPKPFSSLGNWAPLFHQSLLGVGVGAGQAAGGPSLCWFQGSGRGLNTYWTMGASPGHPQTPLHPRPPS